MLFPEGIRLDREAEGLLAISDRYLSRRLAPFSNHEATAFALYYGVHTFAKLQVLLQLIHHPVRSILDVGCGTGGGAAAAQLFFPEAPVFLFEKDPAMVMVAERLLPQAARIPSLVGKERYDLVIAANVINELGEGDRFPFVSDLIARLSSHGTLLILEPAQVAPTRALMLLRDQLFGRFPELYPLFPCPHRKRCPLLIEKEEWCHGEFAWEEPELHRQLDQRTGFNKHRLKGAALMVSLGENKNYGPPRVIHPPKPRPFGSELTLCHPSGDLVTLEARRPGAAKARKIGLLDGVPLS